ncbi:MAG: alpha/beta fold hydrolase, partial [Alphaproteobacteria bacterium]|nr:alpha/beta fold hydrolase [Alphaproteobacteria bacterium]
MPIVNVNGADIHYTDTGAPKTGGTGEVIVFSHGLLMSSKMFEKQIAHFRAKYRCIAYDHRGQGQSEITKDGYDMDTIAADAAALIRALDLGKVHFAGLSMGGFAAMRLGIGHGDILRSIILLDSSADAEPEAHKPKYRKMNFFGKWLGLWSVAGKVMPILFGQSFLNDPARSDERKAWQNQIASSRRKGMTRAVKGVIDRDGVYERLGAIKTPTLVIVGSEDVATVPAKSERIKGAIAGAQLVILDKGGHSSTIEEPKAVNAAIEAFIQS